MYSLSHAINAVSPVILLLVIGKLLAHLGLLDKTFIQAANKLAYNFFLPMLLFNAVSQADLGELFNLQMMLSGFFGTLIAFGFFILCTFLLKFPYTQRGVAVQGSFRANMGILGLALCGSLLGEKGLALGSVYLGLMVPTFNVLSVWVLVLFSSSAKRPSDVLMKILKSPLVIAILLALPFAIFSIPLPTILRSTTSLLGQATLPLALLCIGATLVIREFSTRLKPLLFIIGGKSIIYPSLVAGLAWGLGVSGDALTVVIIMCLAPTATASFAAVQQLGGDSALAADAVALTTVLSLPLYMLVIYLL